MTDNGRKEKQMKLSIIIPYYKTYDLTIKLLDVLVPQINDEIEVFLIDDGCNETRLDEYEDKINVIHCTQNGGMSCALNIGIKKATGKYIGFIDSDDMITDDYVKELLYAIDNHDAELIYLDWKDMHNGGVVHNPDNYAQWRSIYKREIVPLFDETIRHSSDVPFQDEIDKVPRTRYYIGKVLYIYNSNREGSLTWEKERLINNENGCA